MTLYLDSSVVLRYILSGDTALRKVSATAVVGSSDLLRIECLRVLQRERMEGHLDDHQYSAAVGLLESIVDHLYILELGPAVKLRAAGPFPTVIGTLDAIHLATAMLWKETVPGSDFHLLTYDKQLALCARAMGVQVV